MGQIETADTNATISRTVTIASGQTVSGALDLRYIRNATNALNGNVPVLLLQMPAAFTGASLTFQVSCDNGTTYQTLYDDNGTAVTVLVAASRTIACPSLASADLVKLVSASAEGADRIITIKAGAGGATVQRSSGASGGSVAVSNFSSPAALADATANPTTTLVGSLLEAFNGTTWDRVRSSGDNADAVAVATLGEPLTLSRLTGYNGTTWDRLRTFATGILQVFSGANVSTLATAVTVATTATVLPASALSNRKSVTVFNNDATVTMFVGGSAVTTSSGVPILAQSAMSFDLGPTALIYGIVAASTLNARVLEAS